VKGSQDMRWYFGFFFVSGFCSLLYELVWLRLAMARFSVTTALVSIVLSAFMVGLGLGSWAAGRFVSRNCTPQAWDGLRLYALTELLIGVSALLVPYELSWGRIFLERMEAGTSLSAGVSYLFSGIWIGLTLVPWCACMGATFPFAMTAIRERFPKQSPRSFSYLYLANVCGAMTGALIPLLFIEEWGFIGTLRIGAALNLALAMCAFALSMKRPEQSQTIEVTRASPESKPQGTVESWPRYLLFATGLTSMGVEVVWVRLFTPFVGTVVYAFATILGLYLGATYLGSWIYRTWIYRTRESLSGGLSNLLLAGLAFSVLLPLAACDTRLPVVPAAARVVALIPFSIIVGFITPMLLDRFCQGDPNRAGRGYAINIVGCVLGPLIAGFLLLPLLGERVALCAFALPWFAIALLYTSSAPSPNSGRLHPWTSWKFGFLTLASLALIVLTKDYENKFYPREVLRDHTATVIATGTGIDKDLIVNGIGITGLGPATKMMAHLPLAYLGRPPQNALVICFGMGTTYRAVLSWGVRVTAVELVPSVPRVFPYFYADGAKLLQSPLSRVVIDDGRHYMERSSEQYDVITIDPPPPVEAAGSSLLYSKEFYEIAKRHLRAGGILQQWFPQGSPNPTALASVAKAIRESFPYVHVFHSVEGLGNHFLASTSPLTPASAAVLASRLPPAAVSDLLEFGPAHTAEQQFASVTNSEFSVESLIGRAPGNVPALQDDRPVNEYYILRSAQDPDYRRDLWERFLRAIRRI
jgi:predicted membrane-bound spermidine synthase